MAEIEPIYQELADKVTKEKNRSLPFVLKKIANPEQAAIMNELPNTIEVIADKLGIDEDNVRKDMQYLYERGLVGPGKKGWYLVNNLVLLKDRTASANPKYDDNDLFDLLRKMSLENSDNLEERLKTGEEIPPEHIPDPASMFDVGT